MGRERQNPSGTSCGGGRVEEGDYSSVSKARQACQGQESILHTELGLTPARPLPSWYHFMPVT